MAGKLYGVGVGPGDPELLTLKALRLVKEAEVIALPGQVPEDTVAFKIVEGAYPELGKKELLAVPFPMSKDPEVLKSYHDAGAQKVKEVLDQGKNVVFLTLGDPTVYSTYLYVHHRLVAQGYETEIVCSVVNGGELGERKGVNVPNVAIRLPAITEKDKDDIRFGVEQDIDFIAASFVRNAECILEIRSYLNKCGAPYIPIIAKIENSEGIDNIDEIIRCADGIMVARGDLGVEIPAEEVPYLQKLIIQKCNDNYKPVITATQMLDSMIRNPRPTRAEVGDVANAVYDGTDAVMLSGETAQGKYPVEALKMMVHIVESTEQHLDYKEMLEKAGAHRMRNASSALAYATVTTARNLKAACIITPTVSGATARVVSKFKPKTEIIGISPNEDTLRRMQIYWGVRPYCSINANSTDEICSSALDLVRAKQIAETGDTVVLTAGIPSPNISGNVAGVSNIMKIAVID